MKRLSLLMLVGLVVLAGCMSTSPYDYLENWLIREDPVRTFVIPSDLIYVQGDLYTKAANVPMMQDARFCTACRVGRRS